MTAPADHPRMTLARVAPSPEAPDKVDLVIIGGGIAGVTAAFFAARSGLRVCLCEKGEIAAEQSSRNWGWVRQMGRDPTEMPLTVESLRLWRRMQPDFGLDVGYRETGITYLFRSAREIAEGEDWARTGTAFGLSQRMLRDREIAELLPGIRPGFSHALHTASDGRAEPKMAAPAIAEGAKRAGVRILTRCAVRGIETSAGRVSGVVTESGRIGCTAVVVAAGAWSRLFLGNLGIDFPQLKLLATAARLAPVDGVPAMPVGSGNFAFRHRLDGGFTIALRNTNVAPVVPDSFRLLPEFFPTLIKSWRELKIRVGAQFFRELSMPRKWRLDEPSPFESIRTLDPEPSARYNQRALANLTKAFPAFDGTRLTHHWAGLIDATPDGVPVIGPIPAMPGLYLSSGYSGHGFGIGPGAGLLTAQLVTGEAPIVDPSPFAFERFSAGKHSASAASATLTEKV